ncbi:methyl-accepting chemotaxis protein [Bdellovibrio sp. NC01]|uniref:methyl-accepting chemotaxis protein n=1 Tax=Bdellovibrio sp. NC01 TaxID=2220073 RepID=UPI00115740D9|nr:methyl-accepting chemotaxis protein [Bdellovibrio sp. NC01]QDK37020.1 methyl-accepting chemotaxis protein [Bdellovibrio sp. NC01]
MKKNYSIQVKLAAPIILIALFVFAAMNVLVAVNSLQTAKKEAMEKSLATARSYANEMRLEVERGFDISRTMAHQFQSFRAHGFTSREPVHESLKEILVQNKFLIGAWTGWEPNAWDGKDAQFANSKGTDQTGRFVPYLNWENGKASLTPLLGYDKQGDGDYYLVPKSRNKETLIEPYLYQIDGKMVLMTSAVVPINIDDKFVGVAGVDLPLKEIQKQVASIKPYESTEAYLLTSKNNYASHPDDKLITKQADFPFESAKFKAAISEGKDFEIVGYDPTLKEEVLFVAVPMKLGFSGDTWTLLLRTPTKAVMAGVQSMIWTQIMIALAGTLILLAAVMLMAKYIAKSIGKLSSRLHESSEHVTSAIFQLSQAGQNLSESASSSAASLEETVASLEEMSSMVKMNSENAKQASALSSASSESAVRGEQEMQDLLRAMEEISQSSKKIEEIITVIDDIAFQTNLLALNASVEAARAGEHGKGFAVVAEAVRTLAQRSAVAAKDITTLIKESVEKIDRGTTKADRSGEVLKSIVQSVKKVSDLNQEISTASEEQSAGIAQISKAMNQLDQSVQTNAASSEEIAGTASEINTQATIMKSATDELNVFVYGDQKQKSPEAEILAFEREHKNAA